MLMRIDPFREFERLTRDIGAAVRPSFLPMDAWRQGDEFVLELDVPGVEADAIDLDVERNVLTVSAQRESGAPDDCDVLTSERPKGSFSRQLVLGDNLDLSKIKASCSAGVLTLRIPVAAQAKSRKIDITDSTRQPKEIHA